MHVFVCWLSLDDLKQFISKTDFSETNTLTEVNEIDAYAVAHAIDVKIKSTILQLSFAVWLLKTIERNTNVMNKISNIF